MLTLKELAMSAFEFGLASQTAFLGTNSQVPFAEDYTRAEALESSEEKDYSDDEPSSEAGFENIIGRSAPLLRVLREVEVVAPTDSGVLIQGETGTGKELIAQAIHNRSARRDRPFVKVNCAAIPSGLLESQLFGHEKGAFTGAITRKPGRFEMADKGTLFLDEVGDIPLELQAKLLRVLQEHEFERLGSTRTQQVDVRVVAATHRDLKQMVEEGTFRSDLYYRLHVALMVPPLRNRREDIPFIVRHFVGKYSQRMNRHIKTTSARILEVLTSYAWPGNVRELQNFIERAVILTPGISLRAPLEELTHVTVQRSQTQLPTLEEMEREHVLRALKESNWVTGGPKGAASKLGMKRTTLAYRIRKLGIPVRPQL
jgi:formate hydrogenlyase transcriptional activator